MTSSSNWFFIFFFSHIWLVFPIIKIFRQIVDPSLTFPIVSRCVNFCLFLGRTRTKDKYRVVYSDHQRLELEKEFHYSRYITIRRKAELANSVGLSERQVRFEKKVSSAAVLCWRKVLMLAPEWQELCVDVVFTPKTLGKNTLVWPCQTHHMYYLIQFTIKK